MVICKNPRTKHLQEMSGPAIFQAQSNESSFRPLESRKRLAQQDDHFENYDQSKHRKHSENQPSGSERQESLFSNEELAFCPNLDKITSYLNNALVELNNLKETLAIHENGTSSGDRNTITNLDQERSKLNEDSEPKAVSKIDSPKQLGESEPVSTSSPMENEKTGSIVNGHDTSEDSNRQIDNNREKTPEKRNSGINNIGARFNRMLEGVKRNVPNSQSNLPPISVPSIVRRNISPSIIPVPSVVRRNISPSVVPASNTGRTNVGQTRPVANIGRTNLSPSLPPPTENPTDPTVTVVNENGERFQLPPHKKKTTPNKPVTSKENVNVGFFEAKTRLLHKTSMLLPPGATCQSVTQLLEDAGLRKVDDVVVICKPHVSNAWVTFGDEDNQLKAISLSGKLVVGGQPVEIRLFKDDPWNRKDKEKQKLKNKFLRPNPPHPPPPFGSRKAPR